MDTGHLHLMLNHLPVLGVPALLALLVWGLAGNIPTVARGALWLTLALAGVTAAVYLTGEAAEELVEGLPTFEERLVERHELVALWTTVMVVATGLLAAAALYLGASRRSRLQGSDPAGGRRARAEHGSPRRDGLDRRSDRPSRAAPGHYRGALTATPSARSLPVRRCS